MKLSVNMFIWSASFGPGDAHLLPPIREAGFEGVELPLFHPEMFDATGLRRAVTAEGLTPIVCSIIPNGLNLVSEDPEIRLRTRTHLRRVIERAAEVGARIVNGPLYAPVGYLPGRRRTADEWAWAIEGYQSIIDALETHDVTLAIEPLNRFETYFLNTAADNKVLCDAVGHPRVGAAFDTFHANIEDKNIAAACRHLAPQLKHVQASENDRGTPGSGHVDWPGLIGTLIDIGYDGWLSIESFGPDLGAFSSAVCIWRDIDSPTESIAFDGIAFLKRTLAAARPAR
jgi:D-psicose/D-tagatose/L-ribulose 3-epimerase